LGQEWFRLGKARLVLIGSGGLDVGVSVAKELGVYQREGVQLVVDLHPQCAVFRSLGAHHGMLRTFTLTRLESLKGLFDWPLRVLKGALPTKSSAGDYSQQGATLVVSPRAQDYVLRFRLIEESPGFPRLNHRALALAVEGSIQVFAPRVSKDASQQAVMLAGASIFLGFALLGLLPLVRR
jgi:hypothetical protein